MTVVAVRPRATRVETTTRVRAARLDWVLMLTCGVLLAAGTLLVWSATSARDDLTAGASDTYLKRQLVNIAIGVVLGVMVAATDHRWVRILAPLVENAARHARTRATASVVLPSCSTKTAGTWSRWIRARLCSRARIPAQ